MEQYWEPFYRLEPPQLPQYVQPLLHAVRMVHTTSRYYNSTANVTALLVKVSNQIILKCRNYLNCYGTKTVWNQPKQSVLNKIKVGLHIYISRYKDLYNFTDMSGFVLEILPVLQAYAETHGPSGRKAVWLFRNVCFRQTGIVPEEAGRSKR